MNSLTPMTGYILLISYGLFMYGLSYFYLKKSRTHTNFLVADRKVGFMKSGFSTAATWIWAPALFIASQKAYQQGLPGVFWFTVPNILCLCIFAYFAHYLRKKFKNGYTLAEYMNVRYSRRVQVLYIISLSALSICQFAVQLLAGGAVVTYLTGIDFTVVTIILTMIALSYSLVSGIRASIMTDVWQMIIILVVVFAVVPLVYVKGGGYEVLSKGFGGISGDFSNVFDPTVAYSFGIVVTIGLLAGPFGDQSFWQRAFTTKQSDVKKAFLFSALVFGVVPIFTSVIGFMAAGMGLDAGSNAQLINIITVNELLPKIILIPFVWMLLSGLVSTLDSGLCSISSIVSTDIMRKSKDKLLTAKYGMVALAIGGILIANIPDLKILYLFIFYGTLRASTLIPTILTIIYKKLSEKGMFYGILTSLCIGVPLFAVAGFNGLTDLKVFGSLFTVLASGIIVILFTKYGSLKEKRN
jgi:Na+/proline symporter